MRRLFHTSVWLIWAVSAFSEDLSQWSHFTSIYLNTKSTGANVAGTVYDFPILIRLDTSNFKFSEAQASGADLRFSKSNGKPLAYEIERWNAALSRAEIWVKVDTLLGNNDGQSLMMYWGKTDALDSSKGYAVFDTSNGFAGVWHLGGAPAVARKNSISAGNPALPKNFKGSENVAGRIGPADSLDGSATGAYLDLGAINADFSKGFSFSVWAYPTALKTWSRLVDLGNGQTADNVCLLRSAATQDLVLESWTGNVRPPSLKVTGAFPLREWQQFTGTITGKTYTIYRNGVLVGSSDTGNAVAAVTRLNNYLGKSNWTGDEYYQGILDEAVLAKVSRSADWIKLTYANQGPVQNLIGFKKPVTCQSEFSISKDTSIAEAHVLILKAQAACATGFFWSTVSGPTPRILDPEVLALQIFIPRISKDTVLVYQFQGTFSGIKDSLRVKVAVVNSIPDPEFVLPVLNTWNGNDSIWVVPTVSNLSGIKASAEPTLNFHWSLLESEADTTWAKDYLILNSSPIEGTLKVQLCLDNNGPEVCQSTSIKVSHATGLEKGPVPPREIEASQGGVDASGRGEKGWPTRIIFRR